jgi:hypothetical protein
MVGSPGDEAARRTVFETAPFDRSTTLRMSSLFDDSLASREMSPPEGLPIRLKRFTSNGLDHPTRRGTVRPPRSQVVDAGVKAERDPAEAAELLA